MYKDIKKIMDRKTAQQKRGMLTKHKTSHIVQDWKDQEGEEELDKAATRWEVKRPEKRFKKYNVSELGNMSEDKENGRCRILYYQLRNDATKEARDETMSAVQLLNKTTA